MGNGLIGKEGISLARQDVKESKSLGIASKTLIFKHEAVAGELEIDLTNLTTPSEALAGGFVQPSSVELAAANLYANKKNFRLMSSRGVELQQWEDYVITGNTKIKFIGNLLALGGSLVGEVFTGYVAAIPATSLIVADARFAPRTYSLPVGQTLRPLGKEYKVGENLLDGSQVGAIKVWRNGTLQMRNVNNATAAPGADGNYQEIDAGGGIGSSIQFNNAPTTQDDTIIVDFGITHAGDFSLFGDMEAMYGALFKIIQDLAIETGNPESTYHSFNPSQVERRAFGDLLSRIASLKTPYHSLTQDMGLITFGAVTTPPVKGSTPAATTDKIWGTQRGDHWLLNYQFHQTSAGSAGSGDYLYSLPAGLSWGPSIIPYSGAFAAGIEVAGQKALVGYGHLGHPSGSARGPFKAFAYDSTRFRIVGYNAAVSTYQSQSNSFYSLAEVSIGIGLKLDAHIVGTPTTKSFNDILGL